MSETQKAPVAQATTETTELGLLDQIVEQGRLAGKDNSNRERGKDLVKEFVSQVLEGNMTLSKDAEAMINQRIAQIDHLLSIQLNEILHHPSFQKLEGSWRGLKYLMDQSETSDHLKIKILNVTKKELLRDLQRAPVKFRKLLARCLDRNPKDRLRDIGEARFLLEEPASGESAPSRSRLGNASWFGAAWVVAAVFAVAAGALGYIAYRHSTEEAPRLLRYTVPLPDKAFFSQVSMPAVSPDGRHMAYVAIVDGKSGLWVRDFDSLSPRLLVSESSFYPFWSPDSKSIGYFVQGKLKRIEVSGGPALTLCDSSVPIGGTWSQNGVIIFGGNRGSGLSRVGAAGGVPAEVTTLDKTSGETAQGFPWFLPDGRHFLYVSGSANDDNNAVYAGDLESKERKLVIRTKGNAIYVSGYLLFMRDRTLMAQQFETSKLAVTGEAVPIAENVDTRGFPDHAYFSASENGALAFLSGAVSQHAQITWLDHAGKVVGTIGGPADIGWAAISPDGKTVAFDRLDEQTGKFDIWLHDLARGTDSRFTFNGKTNRFPVWSPDGGAIAFNSELPGHQSVFKRATTGMPKDEAVDPDEVVKRPTDWSPDGRYIIEESGGSTARTGGDIWVATVGPAAAGEKRRPYLQTEFNEGFGVVSPNGKWLAYRSNETKRNEIYVMTFPNPGSKWQISTNGGNIPVWSRDGKQLYFISPNKKMMAVEIKGTGTNPEAGVPRELFDVSLATNNPRYDVSKDGKFLAPLAVEQTAGAPINVVVNWTAGLKK